jgi:hypothetical protein
MANKPSPVLISEVPTWLQNHTLFETAILYGCVKSPVSPSAKIDVWRVLVSSILLVYDGSFASYTKTKSVESAV